MYEGYRKIKKISTEFQQGIENNQRVQKMLGGYRKYQESIENVRRVSENEKTKHWVSIGYRKQPEGWCNMYDFVYYALCNKTHI